MNRQGGEPERSGPAGSAGGSFGEQVVAQGPIGIALSDREDRFLWANSTLAKLLGRSADSLVGQPVSGVVHPDDHQALGAATEAVWQGELASLEREERWIGVDGEAVWVLERAVLGASADGEPWLVRAVLDIADRRAAEELLIEARTELNERNADLERSNADLAEFAYVVSHDLSEPLRVIAGHVQLLDSRYGDQLDEDARLWIAFAVDGCARLRNLIDDLLAYSRVGRSAVGSSSDLATLVDLDKVVRGVLAGLEASMNEAGARIDVGALPQVRGDASQLGQVLSNLLSNAVKFHRPDHPPTISVSAQRSGADWKICVEDDGIGIPERHHQRVFGLFQRLHRREDFAGTGIGLAICRKVLERHRGRIWLEDASPGGTRFCFTLPALEKELTHA